MADGGALSGSRGSQSPQSLALTQGPWVHVRREPFEFGLLPIPSLMHKEGAVDGLRSLRTRLLQTSNPSSSAVASALAASASGDADMLDARVNSKAIATCLNLPESQAALILETLGSILPVDTEDTDPLAQATSSEQAEAAGADVDHLLLFLFIQSYKRAPHRASYRDPNITADVWPQGPSPFDNVSPTAASALQLKTSLAARQRSLPGQIEEETHQLAFVQKNLASLLSLLAEPNGAGEEVISIEKLDLLGLLLRVNRVGAPTQLLSSVAPFFANSDPAMPAAPVPLDAVHQWLAPRLCFTSDHGPDLPPLSPKAGDGGDVTMSDAPPLTPTGAAGVPGAEGATPEGAAGGASAGGPGAGLGTPTGSGGSGGGAFANGPLSKEKRQWVGAGVLNVDGVAKMSILKGETDVENGTVRVAHCHDSVIYILAPLKYATVIGCSDSIIVLGPAGKGVRVETCERVQLIAPCARIKISNCRESTFYLGTNTPPVIFGDNHSVKVAPYNTFYAKLDYHLAKAGVSPGVNCWDQPLFLTASDPHDPASPSAGTSSADASEESSVLLPPDKFVPFVVPFRPPTEQTGSTPLLAQQTRSNPFILPKPYLTALQQKTKTVESLRQTLKNAVLEEGKKKELTNVIQAHFKEWLLTSGNIRQIYDLARLDRDP